MVSFFWVLKKVLAILLITNMNLVPIRQCFQVLGQWMAIVISFSCTEYLFSYASNFRLSIATKWPFYTSKPPKALSEASICTSKGSFRLIVLTPVMRWLYPFGKLSNISVPNLIFFLSSTNQLEEWLSWSIIWWTIYSNLITWEKSEVQWFFLE